MNSLSLARGMLGLALLLTAAPWWSAGAPPRQPPREEEYEPVKPRPKVPLRVGDDDPDPTPPAKAPAVPSIDLAAQARETKNPAVRDLFLGLKQPHDLVGVKGTMRRVQPIADYLGPRPSFTKPLRLLPFDAAWKPEQPFLTNAEAITKYEAYEEVAIAAVDRFLRSRLDQEAVSSPRHLSRADMLVPAESALAAVAAFHEAARHEGPRKGKGWDEVFQKLQARLREVRLEQLTARAEQGDWPGAFQLADRLQTLYANQPAVRQEIVRLHIRNVEKTLEGGTDAHFIAARQGLEQLEKEILDGRSRDVESIRKQLETLRRRLSARAAQLVNQAEALAKTNQAQAISLLRTAESIWPTLPGVRDARLKLSNAYPILYVGVRRLPRELSPGKAVTDVERQALELLFEGLVKPVSDAALGQRYEPGLAESLPRPLPLGRQFQLARGARWSDGREVTAADVHATVQMLKQAGWLGYAPEWGDLIGDARVEDPFRVQLGLQRGYLDPLALMTFKVLPAHRLKGMADADFAHQPVGSGPYQYEGRHTERQPPYRDYALFRANPCYEGRRSGAEPAAFLPFREIHLLQSVDPVKELQQGQLHLLLDVHAEQIKQLDKVSAGRGKTAVLPLRSRRVYFLAVNHRRGELQNEDLRKAIAHAIDRDKILQYQFRADHPELHHALNGPYPHGCWAADPELEAVAYRPSLVRPLADRARLAGKSLTLKYPRDDERVARACADIKSQVEAATGLEIVLKPLSAYDLRQAVEQVHDFDLAYMHWDFADETYWLWPLFDPRGDGAGGCNVLGYVNDAELQSRFRRALSHRRFQDVRDSYREVHKEIYAKMPLIPLWQLDYLVAIHGDVQLSPAVRKRLDPLRVFADVEQWRLGK